MSKYVEFLKEVFEQFGPIHPRGMFGGYGLFHKGLMFGLVADDVLYLKADETLSPFFEERELEQFSYEKKMGSPSRCLITWLPRKSLTILWKRKAGPLDRMRRPFAQKSR